MGRKVAPNLAPTDGAIPRFYSDQKPVSGFH